MKTIEEKAKAYDDLLVKLQKAKVDNDVCDERYCCVIDDIVPELKEVEDEKIRKGLIGHLKELKEQSVEGSYLKRPEHYDAWIAWLEKQGKQILANSAKTCKDEQNPAWSEYDSAMLDNIIAWIEGKWGTIGGKVGGREAFISFLKSLKDRYTWKPSDEQIAVLEWQIKNTDSNSWQYFVSVELLQDLKRLREE